MAYNVSTHLSTMTPRPKRTERLNLRTTPSEKRLLESAASRQGSTVSDFVIKTACVLAEDILAEEKLFTLPPDRWRAFVSALERPVRPKARLRKLLNEPGVLG